MIWYNAGMKAFSTQSAIAVSRARIVKKKGVVILDLEEYEKLRARAVPTYYLTGKAAERLDKVAEKGLKEYRAGKCRSITSLADLD